MGFQWVNDTQKYHDLPKQIEWYEGMTVFTTSVTHQIHCLVRFFFITNHLWRRLMISR